MVINALDKFNIINTYFQKENSLVAIAKQNNLTVRTLQRWIKKYNKTGLQGLEKKQRTDLGKYRKITDQIKEMVEGLQLKKGKSTISTITRIVNKYCVEQNILPINYHSVRKVVSKIPKDLNVLAKYGDKAYENSYEVIMRRTSKAPNEIWQVDHSMLSIKILVEDKKEENPWLTIIIDDYSRAIMSFCLFIGAPSAIQTSLALRNAIWYKQDKDWPVCGIPAILYTDHGTDFTSTHIEYVCADLKIQLIHSIVAKPKGRGKVERFFLSLERTLIEQLKLNNKTYSLKELRDVYQFRLTS